MLALPASPPCPFGPAGRVTPLTATALPLSTSGNLPATDRGRTIRPVPNAADHLPDAIEQTPTFEDVRAVRGDVRQSDFANSVLDISSRTTDDAHNSTPRDLFAGHRQAMMGDSLARFGVDGSKVVNSSHYEE